MSAVLVLTSASVYDAIGDVDRRISGSDVLTMAGISAAGLLISFCVFLFSMNRKFVRTFFDTKTSYQFTREEFTYHKLDRDKLSIFSYSEQQWRKEIGDNVKEWIERKLPVWLEEDLEWFGDLERSMIPDWAVDDENLLARLREIPDEDPGERSHRDYATEECTQLS